MSTGNPEVKGNGAAAAHSPWTLLRSFEGGPNEFWQALLAEAGKLSGGMWGMLVRRPGATGDWQKLGEWSADKEKPMQMAFSPEWLELVENGSREGQAARPITHGVKPAGQFGVAVRWRLPENDGPCLAVFLLPVTSAPQAQTVLDRLALVADVPLSYAKTRASRQVEEEGSRYLLGLEIMAQFNAEKHFLAAAMGLCNSIASRLKCERVSVGWCEKGYVRLQAMSRTERFDRKMEAVGALETAMDEAVDQDEEIVFPAPEGALFVGRDHEKFALKHRVQNMVSLPIRLEEKVVGVISCERQSGAFSLPELQVLRLIADQAARRLQDLKRLDRWFGARLAFVIREKAAKLIGPEHTWAKLIGASVAILLLVLIFLKVPYRVEAKFILRAEKIAFLSAPFKGFIKEALVRPGDLVTNRQPLVRLNTDELLLEESSAIAEMARFQREAERARATNALAEMQIALSQHDQAKARLELTRFRLEQSSIRAPYRGVVTEGDLRDRIGAPVEQGDTMLKVAQLVELYVEAEVLERDVHELKANANGEIAFVSQPALKFPIRLRQLEPAAVPKEGANVFLVRCELPEGVHEWWRPGMSGICKFDAGKRNLLWIATHRTLDTLRLWLWW